MTWVGYTDQKLTGNLEKKLPFLSLGSSNSILVLFFALVGPSQVKISIIKQSFS